jgi:hypothetical protein
MRTATVIAVTFVHLLELRADSLRELVKYHPEYEEAIRKIARQRGANEVPEEETLLDRKDSARSSLSLEDGGSPLLSHTQYVSLVFGRIRAETKHYGVRFSRRVAELLDHPRLHIEVINPLEGLSGKMIFGWDLFILLMYIFFAVFTPGQVAFSLYSNNTLPLYWIQDFILPFDLYLRCHTAVVVNHSLVFERKQVSAQIRHLYVQLALSMPFDLIAYFATDAPERWVPVSQFPRLLLVLYSDRLTKCFPIFAEQVARSLSDLIVGTVSVLHFFACAWVWIGLHKAGSCSKSDTSWICSVPYLVTIFEEHTAASVTEVYITSYYFVTSTCLGFGFADILPTNSEERLMTAGFLLSGAVIMNAVLAVTALLMGVNAPCRKALVVPPACIRSSAFGPHCLHSLRHCSTV